MTCEELIGFLDRYLAGELDDETSARFAGHLDSCPACRDYLDGYEATIRLGHRVCCDEDGGGLEGAPEDLVQAILGALRKNEGGGTPQR